MLQNYISPALRYSKGNPKSTFYYVKRIAYGI